MYANSAMLDMGSHYMSFFAFLATNWCKHSSRLCFLTSEKKYFNFVYPEFTNFIDLQLLKNNIFVCH